VTQSTDLAIIGGGIVGLGTALAMTEAYPRLQVVLLDKESQLGSHQTGHNSGVIHAGIYYPADSLKARLCVEGRHLLYDFCQRYGVPHAKCGKLIVATEPGQVARLEELERRGTANGVPGLARVDRDRIAEIEPHVRALDGLHSPETGIVDYGQVAAAYADDVESAGGTITTGCGVTGVRVASGWLRLTHTSGETRARHALFCAGGWSDRLATMAGGGANPRIVPFRGAYMRLRPERRSLVRGMVYPVPDPELPFLGVHLTRRIDGEVLIGPSALLAGARDAYSLRRVRPADLVSTLTWPGTYRMAQRFWRTGIDEARHLLPGGSFVATAAEFVPELKPRDVLPGFAGVRAQAVDRAGRLVDDFVFSHTDRALHVRNAPSPGATSSLAIARYIADEAQRAFDLPHN